MSESQQIMIIEILVPRRQAQQTLGNQFTHGVFGEERVALIAKATSQAARDAQALIISRLVIRHPRGVQGDCSVS